MNTPAPIVNCPQCGEPTVFAPANRYRPFCSERCRLIDLGAWASDGYRVAGDPLDSDNLSESHGELADRGQTGNGLSAGQANRRS